MSFLSLSVGAVLALGAAYVGSAVNVTTTKGLVKALSVSEPHIVISDHLDLRLPVADTRYFTFDSGSVYPLGVLEPTAFTQTIRGDCTAPVPWSLPGASILPLRPGQCMLLTSGTLLGEDTVTRVFSLWLDNLYLRLQRNASHVAKANYAAMFALFSGSERVWLTRSTVQGDVTLDGDFVAFEVMSGAGMFINDTLVTDVNLAGLGGGAFVVNATLSVDNTTFSGVSVTSVDGGYVMYLSGDTSAAMLVGDNVSFKDNAVTDNLMRIDETSVIYGNSSVTAIAEYLSGAPLPLEPADEAPSGIFLAMDGDAEFARIAEGIPTISADLVPTGPVANTSDQSPSKDDDSSPPGDDGASLGGIVGGVVSGVVILVVTVAAIFVNLAMRRRRRMKEVGKLVVGRSKAMDGALHSGAAYSTHALANLGRKMSAAMSSLECADVAMQDEWSRHIATDALTARAAPRAPVAGLSSPSVSNMGQRQGPEDAVMIEQGLVLRADRTSDVVRPSVTGAARAQQVTTGTWISPKPVLPGHTHYVSITNLDLGTAALATRPGVPPLDEATALELSLDRAHRAGCPVLGTYLPLGGAERCCGGQGCVQFVRDVATLKDYAVKFFLHREAFEREAELYRHEGLSAMMPATISMCRNQDGTHSGPDGFVFPPFIIIDRGESLVEWQRRWEGKFEIATALQALIHIANRLKEMHEAGWVHMDLKPSNVLWLPQQHAWSLIDFGCTALAGKQAPLAFTPAYAAPEIIAAYEARQRVVVVEPSADIWSFGVVAYEMLTDSLVFKPGTPRAVIMDALMGRTKLPWEAGAEGGKPTGLSKLRAFRSSVMQCLNREAAKRPSINTLLNAWYRVFDAHATTTVGASVAGKAGLLPLVQ